MAVFGVNGVNPAQIGLVLTYTSKPTSQVSTTWHSSTFLASLTQMFGMVTRQSAEVEVFVPIAVWNLIYPEIMHFSELYEQCRAGCSLQPE